MSTRLALAAGLMATLVILDISSDLTRIKRSVAPAEQTTTRPDIKEDYLANADEPHENEEVSVWLSENGLSEHRALFDSKKFTDLFQCSRPEMIPTVSDAEAQSKLIAASKILQKRLILRHWLNKNAWGHLARPLEAKVGVFSLQDLSELDTASAAGALPDDVLLEVIDAQSYLPSAEGIAQLEHLVWTQLLEQREHDRLHPQTSRLLGDEGKHAPPNPFARLILLIALFGAFYWIWDLGVTPSEVIFGIPLHKSYIRISWPDNLEVENTKTLSVAFYDLRGNDLDVSERLSEFAADVWHEYHTVTANVSSGPERNVIHIVFTSRHAGRYYVRLRAGDKPVRGFPVHTFIETGKVAAETTVLLGVRSSTLVLTSGVPETVQIDARDSFSNSIPRDRLPELAARFSLKILRRLGSVDGDSEARTPVNFVVYHTPLLNCLCGSMAFGPGQEGWYCASILLDGKPIGRNVELTIIVLCRPERTVVNSYLHSHDDIPSFSAELVAENGVPLNKPKACFCQLTPKQLAVKEYFLRIFPRRLFTFRLVPATKISLVRYSGQNRAPVIRIEDSFQSSPELVVNDGSILAATFQLLLLNKIGGSESFRDKQRFFNTKLLRYHQERGNKHSRLQIKIDRANIVESSARATRWFGESDWCRLLEVEFENEPGVDQGGLRREWFEVLCKKLFHPSTNLFISVEDGSEAVYPNPNAASKSKWFKFAGRIVGKCLYESAHGATYRQHMPARLAKSFLAQLVGLRVNYKRHFAADAPELYASKIRFIEENAVRNLDLYFTDEEFGKNGELLRVVDLKPEGSRIPVDEANKFEYLDLLAQHRLCTRIKDQTEQFLSGLHQFVPDSLLSLFDEYELELLLCGVREYSLAELKAHHTVVYGALSPNTLEWFWMALSAFTPEQMARLLQFSTGSSQLPPGGFAELKPNFQIASSVTVGSLPTAHTCFNMICLPEHTCFKNFETALLTAINEGNEGFGLA